LLGVSAAAAGAEAAAAAAAAEAVKNLSSVEAPVGARLKLEADMNIVTMRKPFGLQGSPAQHSTAIKDLSATFQHPTVLPLSYSFHLVGECGTKSATRSCQCCCSLSKQIMQPAKKYQVLPVLLLALQIDQAA
jgi:hypothetical protein